MSLILEPYKEDEINAIDVYSTNVCAITVLLGLFIYKNEYNLLIYCSFVLIIVINIWFFTYLVRKIINSYAKKFETLIQGFKIWLTEKIPCLKKFVKTN